MELQYSMRRKPLKYEPPQLESLSDPEVVRPVCAISVLNIIAFTSSTELLDTEGDSWGGHVYVCDLDTPWDCHKVASTNYPVSVLEWDDEGKQLLIATSVGNVTIYAMKEHHIKEWTSLYTATFDGEHIGKALFFHNGRMIVPADKKPDAPITEKFQNKLCTPTLKGFGGIAVAGACFITQTGLVGTVTSEGNSKSIRVTSNSILAADMKHKNGSILIAGICRCGTEQTIRVWAYTLPPASDGCAMSLHTVPAIAVLEPAVSVSWYNREDGDCLLVGAIDSVSLWKLQETKFPIHKLFSKGPPQGNLTPGGGQKQNGDCFNTLTWQQASTWPIQGCIVHASNAGAVITHNTVSLLPTHTHQKVSIKQVVSYGTPSIIEGTPSVESATPPKKSKYSGSVIIPAGSETATASYCCTSTLGGVIIVIDTHSQLHVYTSLWPNIPQQLLPQHLSSQLEYALVTGYDYTDILMACKQNVIEAAYERITESFQRQPQPFQQYYYPSWLKLRAGLCRSVSTLQSSATALICTLALRYAACQFSSHLRQKHDLIDLLHLETKVSTDKTLLSLESKPEPYPDTTAHLMLRRSIQQVYDIAITQIAIIASGQTPYGYEIYSDPTAMSLVRRLVVVCRCLSTTVLGEQISRVLSRVHAHATSKPDLIEECMSLCVVCGWTRVWEAPTRYSVTAPHGSSPPFYLAFGTEREELRYHPEPPTSRAQYDITTYTPLENIRYNGKWIVFADY